MSVPQTFGQVKFGIKWTTLNFVLLNFATLGIFWFIWIWRFINKVSPASELKTVRILGILAIAFWAWGDALEVDALGELDIILSGLFDIAAIVFILILSFKTKPFLENIMAQSGLPCNLNGAWCFFLPFWYQYYIIYNAETVSYKQQQRVMLLQQHQQQQQFREQPAQNQPQETSENRPAS